MGLLKESSEISAKAYDLRLKVGSTINKNKGDYT